MGGRREAYCWKKMPARWIGLFCACFGCNDMCMSARVIAESERGATNSHTKQWPLLDRRDELKLKTAW